MGSSALLAAVAFVLLSGGALLAAVAAENRRETRRQRLQALSGRTDADEPPPEDSVMLLRPVSRNRFPLLPQRIFGLFDVISASAGYEIGKLQVFAVAILGVGIGSGFAVGVLGLSPPFAIGLGLAGGIAAPVWLVRRAQRKFQQRFLDSFPDALDLMVRAVRAGLPVTDAITVAADEMPAPVGTELRRTIDQMRIGVDLEEALKQSAERIRVADFWFFAVALSLQRRTGGALAETLGKLSALIRRRKELRVKARAVTAESRASTMVLGALPFAVGFALYLVNGDEMTSLVADPRGRVLFGMALLLLGTGILSMVLIVKRTLR